MESFADVVSDSMLSSVVRRFHSFLPLRLVESARELLETVPDLSVAFLALNRLDDPPTAAFDVLPQQLPACRPCARFQNQSIGSYRRTTMDQPVICANDDSNLTLVAA